MAEEDKVSVKALYQELKDRAEKRKEKFSRLDFILRARQGIKAPHAKNILELYWYFIFVTDKHMYERLKTVDVESEMRNTIFGGKVQTEFVSGERHIVVCTDMFPNEFLEIVDAYIEYVDQK